MQFHVIMWYLKEVLISISQGDMKKVRLREDAIKIFRGRSRKGDNDQIKYKLKKSVFNEYLENKKGIYN